MRTEIARTQDGKLMLSVHADSELEGIAIERWQEENREWLESCPLGTVLISSYPCKPDIFAATYDPLQS